MGALEADRYDASIVSQWTRILNSAWLWIVVGLVVLAGVFLSFFELRIHHGDPRGVGGAEQIEALSERDDVNVLFILIDMVRADRLGAYGYERDTSPNLALLASRGVRFANTQAQSSWTKASMASLWTSLYPARAGVTRHNDVAPEEARMPAEILKEAGFRTVGLWRNGWVDPSFGFGQGFDVYHRPASAPDPPSIRRENPTLKTGGTDEDALNAADEFLRVFGDDRWFLYLHLMDVHEYLYDESSALFGTTYSDVYDNSIRRVDGLIGQFLVKLAERGFLENTVIVIASDHGEAFRERGYEGHARWVYRETTEVPLIISLPFMLEPGVVVEARARNIDVWPTIFDLLGLPARENVDGRSLLPALRAAMAGEEPGKSPLGIAHLDKRWGRSGEQVDHTVSLVDGPFRFVQTYGPAGKPVREQLFDSRADSEELENVIEQHPGVAEDLREQARAYIDDSVVPWSEDNPTVELDEMQLNLLRALGYQLP